MKKTALILCVFALLAALTSIVIADEPAYDIPLADQGDPAHYGAILEDVTAMLNGQEPAYFAAGDELSSVYSMVANSEYAKNFGYAVVDINGDNVDELLIGENQGEMNGTVFYNGFTLVNDQLKELFNGGERDCWYVSDGNTFVNVGANSAFSSGSYAYTLDEGNLKFSDGIVYDSEAAGGPWFKVVGADAAVQEPISEAEVTAFEDAHPYLNIELTPFVK